MPTTPTPGAIRSTAATHRGAGARLRHRRCLLRMLAGLVPAALLMVVAALGVGDPAVAQPSPPTPAPAPAAPTPLPNPTPPPEPPVADHPPEIQIGPVVTPAPPVPAPPPPPWIPNMRPQPAWWDIPGQVNRGITDLLGNLVFGALSGMLDLITRSLLAIPDLTQVPQIHELITITRWIANTCFVLLVVAGGYVVAAHETVQNRYSLRELLPRVVGGFVALNAAPSVISLGITVTNALINALLGQQSVEGITINIRQVILSQTHDAGLFLLVLLVNVLVLTVLLLAVYLFRLIVTILVVVAAPLALACHALPYAEGIAVVWWRALIGVLAIRFLQAIVFIVYVKVFFEQNAEEQAQYQVLGVGGTIVNILLATVLLFILVKIPGWVLRGMGMGRGRSTLGALLKFTAITTVLRGVRAAASSAGRMAARSPSAARSAGRWFGNTLRPGLPTVGFGPSGGEDGEGGSAASGSPVRPTPLPPTLSSAGAKPLPQETQKVTLTGPRLERSRAPQESVRVRHAREQALRCLVCPRQHRTPCQYCPTRRCAGEVRQCRTARAASDREQQRGCITHNVGHRDRAASPAPTRGTPPPHDGRQSGKGGGAPEVSPAPPKATGRPPATPTPPLPPPPLPRHQHRHRPPPHRFPVGLPARQRRPTGRPKRTRTAGHRPR